jgi:hypothetical protein
MFEFLESVSKFVTKNSRLDSLIAQCKQFLNAAPVAKLFALCY